MRHPISLCLTLWLFIAVLPAATAKTTEIERQFASLLIADEIAAGYNRDLFPHWIDADRNGCNTRYEVLIAEAVVKPRIGSSCRLSGGKWRSFFDNTEIVDFRIIDVDHFVPLAEAWRSGADTWTTQQRTAFANDLDLADALIAVSRSSNRSKSDRDVANWLPANPDYRYEYLTSWVKVKAKWKLRVDPAERKALEDGLISCGILTNRIAPKFAKPSSTPEPELKPTQTRYQNCTIAKAAGVTPIRKASNAALYQLNQHLDRDKDGIACE